MSIRRIRNPVRVFSLFVSLVSCNANGYIVYAFSFYNKYVRPDVTRVYRASVVVPYSVYARILIVLFTLEPEDSYGYEYPPEELDTSYGRSQLASYEEAFSVGQEALRASQASMLARDRRYPRSYDSGGYAPDSTDADSTEARMNLYEVTLLLLHV